MWRYLPLYIRQHVRQRTGYRMPSLQVSDRGFDICGMRECEAGDSPRTVSRKHYTRTGGEIVLEKRPLRNAFVLFLLDASASEQIGSDRIKYEASLELLRHLGWAFLWKGNVVQMIAFTTRVEWESPVIYSTYAFEEALEELSDFKPEFSNTDHRDVLDQAVSQTMRLEHPADLVSIISDFLFPQPRGEFYRDLLSLNEEADVIALILRDRIEEDIPPVSGSLMVRDSETGETFWASGPSGSDPVKELGRYGIDACTFLTSQTEEEWFSLLLEFFTMRMEER